MYKVILGAICSLFFSVSVVLAQVDCPTIVEEALQKVDDHCAGIGRNSACYGADVVERTTVEISPPDDFFVAPRDRAQLVELREIRPQAMNEEDGTFGVGLLHVQANIPNTLPGQAVLFLLTGDARLVNDVPPDDTEHSPFQSFYFLPGIGRSNCYEAEPMVTIQTPGNVEITVTFNGVRTDMSPGTLLTVTPTVCTVHRGHIVQYVGDETAVLLANQTVDIRIDDHGAVIPLNLRGISEREFERGEQIQQTLNALAAASDWTEQFVRQPDDFAEEPERESLLVETSETSESAECDTVHTVRSGESLHRIARNYDTSVLAIVEANGLENPRLIYTGQTLCIPNPGSGFVPLPPGS